MRIVAGRWRGRKIEAPPDKAVRPTLDSVREAWMSIIQFDLPDARVLDLFAGSGALGLEALSRGASGADFVEKSGRVARTLRDNIRMLGAEAQTTVHQSNALTFIAGLSGGAYDVAFADPPYTSENAVAVATRWLEVPFASVLTVEHPAGMNLPGNPSTRRYGSTGITIYRSEE